MKISEIFFSIQGEGILSGRAAAFIRFYGCNLECSFCDEPLHKDTFEEISEEDIIKEVKKHNTGFVVITGGEPSLNDLNAFIKKLKNESIFVAVETNGFSPGNISQADWKTYSPKDWDNINYDFMANEIKLVVNSKTDIDKIQFIKSKTQLPLLIQPEANFNELIQENIDFCVNFVLENPTLILSLQNHKMLKIK